MDILSPPPPPPPVVDPNAPVVDVVSVDPPVVDPPVVDPAPVLDPSDPNYVAPPPPPPIEAKCLADGGESLTVPKCQLILNVENSGNNPITGDGDWVDKGYCHISHPFVCQ